MLIGRHEDILGDRGILAERDFLMDEAYAKPLRGGWRCDGDVLAFETNGAFVGLHNAGDDIHQRGLARAVLAAQRVNFAALQREIDPGQRFDGAEGFRDVADFKNGGGSHSVPLQRWN